MTAEILNLPVSAEDKAALRKSKKIAYNKEWAAKNREKMNAASRRWQKRNSEKKAAYSKKRYETDWKKAWTERAIASAKIRAFKKDIPFAITKADLTIPEFCPILGIRLSLSKSVATGNSPSLDRINPKLGYVPGNVAVISYRANMIKSCGTAAEHERIAQWIRQQGL